MTSIFSFENKQTYDTIKIYKYQLYYIMDCKIISSVHVTYKKPVFSSQAAIPKCIQLTISKMCNS